MTRPHRLRPAALLAALPPALVAPALASVLGPVPALAAPATAPASAPDPTIALTLIRDLTTAIGPRLDGSPAEARARDWAVARLNALGFKNVHIEPFTIRGYVRGTDRAELVGEAAQPLAVSALGYSGATPEAGITAPLVWFRTLADLARAPADSLTGKIAFIDHAMAPTQDGSGYGPFGDPRRKGPTLAARKGALAVVIRPAGTDHHRNPHTGVTSWAPDVTPIPAASLSNPDADQLERLFLSGVTPTLHLTLTGHTTDGLLSGNVVADLPGRDPSLAPVLVACHLDSWDLGTGAIDNAAGCGIVTAAALNVAKLGVAQAAPPLRTIRVLWAGSEELGGFGGIAYAKAHGSEAHFLAMESDFGADRVWRVRTNFASTATPLRDQLFEQLLPKGVVPDPQGDVMGGEDVGPIIALQHLPVVDLDEDGTHYFDWHHTPDDTFDKIDPTALAQNVEAWSVTLALVANQREPITAAVVPHH